MIKRRSLAPRLRGGAVALLFTVISGAAATLPFAFNPPVSYPAGPAANAVVVADFNGDNKPDLTGFWTEGSGALVSYRGYGDGTFAMPGSNYVSFPARFGAQGDFNKDGHLDLLTIDANFPFARVLLGRGDGTFSNRTTVFLTGSPYGAVSEDFNGDGHLDAAISLPTAISIFLGDGQGRLTSFTNSATGYNGGITYQTFVATGDLNGDGKPDLAAVSVLTNIVSVLIGNGNGTFLAPVHYVVGESPNHLALADLNGDGRLDIVTANAGAATVSIRLGNGDGTFAPGPNVSAGGVPYSVAVADLNGDGRPDIATANRPENAVAIFAGNGNGTFQAATNFPVGNQPIFITAADLNGDGKSDLAVANKFSDDLTVLLNQAITPRPTLTARPQPGGRLQLTWSTFGTALFGLQSTADITSPSSWTNLLVTPVASNGFYGITFTNSVTPRGYFRLRQP